MSDPTPLSPSGEQRRAEILRLAQAEARHRRHRRQSARAAAAGAAAVLLTVLLTHRWVPPSPVRPIVIQPKPAAPPVAVVITPPPTQPPRPMERKIAIEFIKTEPNIARLMAVPPQKPTWQRLSDDELIKELADAGHPAGLAWVDGREFVLYRPPNGGSDRHSRDGGMTPAR